MDGIGPMDYRLRNLYKKAYRFVKVALIVILLLSLAPFLGGTGFSAYCGNLARDGISGINSWVHGNSLGVMRSVMPVMAYANPDVEHDTLSLRLVFAPVLSFLKFDENTAYSLLQREVPLLAGVDLSRVSETMPVMGQSYQAPPPDEPDEEQEAAGEGQQVALTPDTLAIIYHTHTGETYALTDGTERLNGKRGGVVTVGAAMKEELEKRHGIKTVHSDKINDENYNTSYTVSQGTAEGLLKDNPAARVIMDIHRDAGKSRENSLVKVKGKEVAPILFVVGSDQRAPFPNWRKNYEFAKLLSDRAGEMYPGLCIGVMVKEGRYNQFLHPNALLLEIGSVSNSTEEAVESARMFADVLGKVIGEMMAEDGGEGTAPAEEREA